MFVGMTKVDECDPQRESPLAGCREFLAPVPKDRRVRRTIESLHEAVVSLLPEKPFELISVQDIADRAGVSRPAFYSHFNDKFALMEYIVDTVFDRFLVESLDQAEADTAMRLRKLTLVTCGYLTEIFKQCRHARRLLDPLIQAQISTRLHDILKRWLERDAARGLGSFETVELTATVVGWSIYGSSLNWARQAERGSASDFVEQGYDTIVGGYHNWLAEGAGRREALAGVA